MSAANQKKFQKSWGQGDRIIKKQREKQMNNQDYIRYIFWIVLAVIVVSTLSGS
jgi:Ni/Co efflux regulator RcnB